MADSTKTIPADLGGSLTPTAVLKDKRGISASLSEVLGAVAISIGVIALAAFGIGAGINYSQDSNAKATLDSIKSAQILHQSKTNGFGDLAALTTGDAPALTSIPTNATIKLSTDKRNYCALVESGSMAHTLFWITSKDGKIVEEAPTGLAGGLTCPTAVSAP